MLRRRIQVHLQRLSSMDFDRAAPSCIAGAVLRIPVWGCCNASSARSARRHAPIMGRDRTGRRATLATMQLRDVIDG